MFVFLRRIARGPDRRDPLATVVVRREWSATGRFKVFWRGLLCLYAVIVLVSCLALRVGEFDESIPLVGGYLVEQGRTPNVDFWSIYPPLAYYMNAAAFRVLGRTVLAQRALAAVLFLMLLGMAARFYWLSFPHSRLLTPGAVLLLAVSAGTRFVLPPWPAYIISELALLTYLRAQGGRRATIAGAGLLTAAAFLSRVNFGAYVILVVMVDLLLHSRLASEKGGRWPSFKKDLSTAASFVFPLVAGVAGACIWLYGLNIGAAFYQCVVFAQRLMGAHRFIELVPSVPLLWAIVLPHAWFCLRLLKGARQPFAVVLAPAITAAVVVTVAMAARANPAVVWIVTALELSSVVVLHLAVYKLERSELCLLLFACCLLHYFLSRADNEHLKPLIFAGCMLLPFGLFPPSGSRVAGSGFFTPRWTALTLTTIICAVLLTLRSRPKAADFQNGLRLITSGSLYRRMPDSERLLGAAPAGAWGSLYPHSDELRALRFVRDRTSSEDAIFVGVADHSRVFWNDVRAYWIGGRPVGIRHYVFEPGLTTEASIQDAMILDLRRNGVKWAIIEHTSTGDKTYLKRGYVGAGLLDSYLATNFREDARFGQFSVLRAVEP